MTRALPSQLLIDDRLAMASPGGDGRRASLNAHLPGRPDRHDGRSAMSSALP